MVSPGVLIVWLLLANPTSSPEKTIAVEVFLHKEECVEAVKMVKSMLPEHTLECGSYFLDLKQKLPPEVPGH